MVRWRGLGGTETLLWVTVRFDGVRERPAGRIMPEKPETAVGVGLSRVRTDREDGARGPWLPVWMAVAPDDAPTSWLDESGTMADELVDGLSFFIWARI